MNETTHHRPPQEKVCGYEYTVRRGDSFYLIANRLGVPLRDLLEANQDVNPARLMVGDVLCIPMEEDDAPPAQEPVPETSLEPEEAPSPDIPAIPEEPEIPKIPEEILPDVEEDLDVPAVDEEMAVCPEANRYVVRHGETAADVQLKADINRYTLQTANPSVDLNRLQAGQVLCVPAENTACPAVSTYILQAEDSIETVALRLNTSLAALLRANPCLAPSDFTAGRCIAVP